MQHKFKILGNLKQIKLKVFQWSFVLSLSFKTSDWINSVESLILLSETFAQNQLLCHNARVLQLSYIQKVDGDFTFILQSYLMTESESKLTSNSDQNLKHHYKEIWKILHDAIK